MRVRTQEKISKRSDIRELQAKAAILDELMEFIEDKYFGYLMNQTEKEQDIPLSKAKKMLYILT